MVLQRHSLPVSRLYDLLFRLIADMWLYSLAVDLDLGRAPSIKPTDERGEREVLNRLRTYIVCYIIDRCFCINLGKPTMMPENDVRAYEDRFTTAC